MKRPVRILSIDGGGIRGIIAGEVLASLERKLVRLTGNKELKLGEYFDFIAGSSTGGILTSILLSPEKKNSNKPRFGAGDALDLYYEHGREIFDSTIWQSIKSAGGFIDERYNAAALEKYLDQYFGKILLSDLIKPCLITGYDISKRKAVFFTSHDAKKNKSKDFYLRDVARATSAAPTYFESTNIRSRSYKSYPIIDGGVFANNPALCAYAEVREKFPRHPTAQDMLLISVGTGIDKDSYEYDDAKDWGMIEWLRPLLSIMMSGVAETVDYQLKKIFESVRRTDQYLRINSEIKHASTAIDDASPENMEALRKEGKKIAAKFSSEMNDFAAEMIKKK
jgi:patatin-like phospholipase/acyl hydrolase